MGCLGVHFSLSEEEVQDLQRVPECERPSYVREEMEEEYFANHPDRMAESDKAWVAMHRALTDGLLSRDGGEYPLVHWPAMIALAAGIGVALVGLVVPSLRVLYDYAWFVGFGVSAVLYLLLAGKPGVRP